MLRASPGAWTDRDAKATPPDLPVAFVEIPKGSRNKYEYDARLERVVLDRTLYASVVYPCDYGFLLDTLGEDGDPLEPCAGDLADVSRLPRARPAGRRAEMRDEAGEDAKILCVPQTTRPGRASRRATTCDPSCWPRSSTSSRSTRTSRRASTSTLGKWGGRERAVEAWARGHERWRQEVAGSA